MTVDAIAFFERAAHDFSKLVDRINEQRKFNQGETTGISWEVRKPTRAAWSLGAGTPVVSPTSQKNLNNSIAEQTSATKTKSIAIASNKSALSTTNASNETARMDTRSNAAVINLTTSSKDMTTSRLRVSATPYEPATMVTDQYGRRRTGSVQNSGVVIITTVGSKITIAQQTDDEAVETVKAPAPPTELIHLNPNDLQKDTLFPSNQGMKNTAVSDTKTDAVVATNPSTQQPVLLPTTRKSVQDLRISNKSDQSHSGSNANNNTKQSRRPKSHSVDSTTSNASENSGANTSGVHGHTSTSVGTKRSEKSANSTTNIANIAKSSINSNIHDINTNDSTTDLYQESQEVTEEVWAAAEAWVEAEAQAEEEEWLKLVSHQRDIARANRSSSLSPLATGGMSVVDDSRRSSVGTSTIILKAHSSTTASKATNQVISSKSKISKSIFGDEEDGNVSGPPESDISSTGFAFGEAEPMNRNRGSVGSLDISTSSHDAMNTNLTQLKSNKSKSDYQSTLQIETSAPYRTKNYQAASREAWSPALNMVHAGRYSNETAPTFVRSVSNNSTASISDSVISGRGSPSMGRERTLHEKLSSPDRRKALSPTEAKRRHEARQIAAESNRDQELAARIEKAAIVSTRIKQHKEKIVAKLAIAEGALEERLKNAEIKHAQHLKEIKGKAGTRNTMVSEVMFINSLHEESVVDELQRRLALAEARTLAAYDRRQERLAGITQSQQKRSTRKAQQMSALRLQLEEQKMTRWGKLQERLNAVQRRKEQRLLEMSGANSIALSSDDKEVASLSGVAGIGASSAQILAKEFNSTVLDSRNNNVSTGNNVRDGHISMVTAVDNKKKDKIRKKRAQMERRMSEDAQESLQLDSFLNSFLVSNPNPQETQFSMNAPATVVVSEFGVTSDVMEVTKNATPPVRVWLGPGSSQDPTRPVDLTEPFASFEANTKKKLTNNARLAMFTSISPVTASESAAKVSSPSLTVLLKATACSSSQADVQISPLQGKVGALLLQLLVNFGLVNEQMLAVGNASTNLNAATPNGETEEPDSEVWRTVLSPTKTTSSDAPELDTSQDHLKGRTSSFTETSASGVSLLCPVKCTSGSRRMRLKLYNSKILVTRKNEKDINDNQLTSFDVSDWQCTEEGMKSIEQVLDTINIEDPVAMRAFLCGGGMQLLRIYLSAELGVLSNAATLFTASKQPAFQRALQFTHVICENIKKSLKTTESEVTSLSESGHEDNVMDVTIDACANAYALGVNVCDLIYIFTLHVLRFTKLVAAGSQASQSLVASSEGNTLGHIQLNVTDENKENQLRQRTGESTEVRQASQGLPTEKRLDIQPDSKSAYQPTSAQYLPPREMSWIEADTNALPSMFHIVSSLFQLQNSADGLNNVGSGSALVAPHQSLQSRFVWFVLSTGILDTLAQVIRGFPAVGRNLLHDSFCNACISSISTFISDSCKYLRHSAGFSDRLPVETVVSLSPRHFTHPRGKEMVSLLRSAEWPVALISLLDSILKMQSSDKSREFHSTHIAACNNIQQAASGALSLVHALVAVASIDINILQKLSAQHEQQLIHCSTAFLMLELERYQYTAANSAMNPNIAEDESSYPIAQLLALLGLACLRNPSMQALVAQPWKGFERHVSAATTNPAISLIVRLCRNLPVRYFTDERYKMQLFPTLITMCSEYKDGLQQLKGEVSSEVLSTHMSRLRRELEELKQNGQNANDKGSSSSSTIVAQQLCRLSARFPCELWANTAYVLSDV